MGSIHRWSGACATALLLMQPVASNGQPAAGGRMVGFSLQSYGVRADQVDGMLKAVGAGAILPLTRLLDLEAEVLWPLGTARRQYTGVAFSFAPAGATREEIEQQGVLTRTTHERRLSAVLSLSAAFHARASDRRVQPRLFAGVTTHFAREESRREPIAWPAGVTLERIYHMQPPVERHRRALGSLTVGAGVAIAVTNRLVLMPDLRYDYGSIGDEINDTWRAGARVLWKF